MKQLEEIAADAPVTPRLELATGSFYESAGRATDGTDISSRAKHAEYCRRNNVSLTSDFKETWAKAAEARGKPQKDPARREALGRAMYAAEMRRK